MNNEAYTAYPSEREILLTEGRPVFILSVDRGVVIQNPNASFASYNGKTLTVVHIFIMG